MKILTSGDSKTVKGEKRGYLTGILYLAPCTTAGRNYSVCSHASRGCKAACLYTAGRGQFSNVQQARIAKTRWLFKDRQGFVTQLHHDLHELRRKALSLKMTPVVRLNGTSDIPWETLAFGCIPQAWEDLQFYCYSKSIQRALEVNKLKNHTAIFSRTEDNEKDCRRALASKVNVAVVFDKVLVGSKYLGHRVIDGDLDDLRFLDPRPRIIGLKAKGRARRDKTGFVVIR